MIRQRLNIYEFESLQSLTDVKHAWKLLESEKKTSTITVESSSRATENEG